MKIVLVIIGIIFLVLGAFSYVVISSIVEGAPKPGTLGQLFGTEEALDKCQDYVTEMAIYKGISASVFITGGALFLLGLLIKSKQ